MILSPHYLFIHSLPLEFQEIVRFGGYILPDLSWLTISFLQEYDLLILRKHAVISFKSFIDENCRICRITMTFNNEHVTSQNLLVDSCHSSSNTEQTIIRCLASDILPTTRPLVIKPNGINYQNNRCNRC